MYESYIEACSIYEEKNVSLERIDVNDDYTKKNCIWIKLADQKSNTRSTIYFKLIYPDGTVITGKNLRKYATEHGLNLSTLTDLVNGRIKTYRGIRGHRIDRNEV